MKKTEHLVFMSKRTAMLCVVASALVVVERKKLCSCIKKEF